MRNARYIQPNRGLTLVELLLVIAIIGILASLLFGAIYKAHAYAKDQTWRAEARSAYVRIRDRLSGYCQSHSTCPVLTAKELHQLGVFDDSIMDFLDCPHVQFTPFSSDDPDDKTILRIPNDWLWGVKSDRSSIILLKKTVTDPE